MADFEYSAQEVLKHLQTYQESARFEAKAGTAIGSSIMQTVCAFANTINLRGGYLLLGVSEPDKQHNNFWVSGVQNADVLLNDLQANCRDQFEFPITIYAQKEQIKNKQVILIYVPELDTTSKPCVFKEKYGGKNKRKTGVWLRGLNGDYEATQKDLEPIILAKSGMSFEQIQPNNTSWDDLDPNAIARYRQLRAKVRPDAIELQADDKEMLFAMQLVNRQADYAPNIAGLLLFGKALSLRRILPDARVDYVRIQGSKWLQENFLETLDLREPLIYTIPKLESKILADMPRHFRLETNQLQRTDSPLLPQKVVRETIVNAVMHRDYQTNEPILIARFDDRLEVKNAGYSLKPTTELGQLGSRLRNPILASALYDIHYAETKGSGIGVICNQLKSAMLALPKFQSDPLSNSFFVSYSFHQLLSESQLAWLKHFSAYQLTQENVVALVLAKENGSVTNTALQEVCNADASKIGRSLLRLVKQGLLIKSGSGRATFYTLSAIAKSKSVELNGKSVELNGKSVELNEKSVELNGKSVELSETLQMELNKLGKRVQKEQLIAILIQLCLFTPMTLKQLADYTKRNEKTLRPLLQGLIKQGKLSYIYPDNPTHPQQRYQAII